MIEAYIVLGSRLLVTYTQHHNHVHFMVSIDVMHNIYSVYFSIDDDIVALGLCDKTSKLSSNLGKKLCS